MNTNSSPLVGNEKRPVACDAALFIALTATAVALFGALSHFLGGSGTGDDGIVSQAAYSAWSQSGYILLIELAAIAAVVVLARDEPFACALASTAILCLAFGQMLFWTYTSPATVAATGAADELTALRRHWEFAHAAGATFQILALGCLVVAAMARIIKPTTATRGKAAA